MPLNALLNSAAETWGNAMSRACWQGGLALASVWLLCRLLPRLHPNLRCWLWRLAYLKLLLALFWTTPIDLPLLPAPHSTVSVGEAQSDIVLSPEPQPETLRQSQATALPAQTIPLTPAVWLMAFWLPLTGYALAQLVAEYRKAYHRRQDTEAVSDSELAVESWYLNALFGRPLPRLLLTERPCTAVLQGVFRPVILIGRTLWQAASHEERHLILAHEVGHLVRRDLLWAWLPNLARCFFFFHPLVWIAERQWQETQEMACDALVLERTRARLTEYGAVLLKAAAGYAPPAPQSAGGLSIVEAYDTLQRRLHTMKHTRTLTSRQAVAAACVLMLSGALTLAPWRLVAEPTAKRVVLWDRSKYRSPEDAPQGMCYDQESDDYPGSATYLVMEVTVPEGGWNVDTVTTYFSTPSAEKLSPQGHSVPHPDGWLKVNKGRLNVFPKSDKLPGEMDDPSKGKVVPLKVTKLKDGAFSMVADGLKLNLKPGKYWIGLTPMYNWKRNGQGFHLMTSDQRKGDEGALRCPGGKGGYGKSGEEAAWGPISQMFFVADSDQEPAFKIEGRSGAQK